MKVSLKAMSEMEFSDYLKGAIPAYAKENTESGRWEETDALERSKKEYELLLPQGRDTKDNYLFNVIENTSNNKVGYIWVKFEVNIRTKSAFIYDIEIFESHRRKGYAKSGLSCIEKVVTDMGATNLGLHVFNHNSAAIALYNSIGYRKISCNMQKVLNESNT